MSIQDGKKWCPGCQEWKPVEAFSRSSQRKDGLDPYCKACNSARYQRRKAEDPERFREYNRTNYQRHTEDRRQSAHDYYYTCIKINPERAERNRARVREWHRHETPEHRKARYQRYREQNRARARRYRQDHREYRREYDQRHRDRWNKMRRERYRADPGYRERCARHNAMRKALRRHSPQATPVDRIAIANRDHWRCHLCGKKIRRQDLTLDHLIPVSQGGQHVDSNVAAAHRSCNSSRQAGRVPAQLRLLG